MRARMMGVLLAVAALFAPGAAWGDAVGDALTAFERGDYSTALPVFRVHAKQGHVFAQFALGLMYDSGLGVPRDRREAVRWYRLAAEQGFANAQFSLGFMYEVGEGVPQDYREAVRWYRLAAEQGFDDAQYNLGLMHDTGNGVLQDFREALRWYRKAAAQGDPGAMANLGVMYGNGKGARQDHVRAYMWANLAAAAGAGEIAVRNRDLSVRRMTPAQIAEAQRLARECLASNYKRCGEPGEEPAALAR